MNYFRRSDLFVFIKICIPNKLTGDCICAPNVIPPDGDNPCSECAENTFGYDAITGCANCSCEIQGTFGGNNESCTLDSGNC